MISLGDSIEPLFDCYKSKPNLLLKPVKVIVHGDAVFFIINLCSDASVDGESLRGHYYMKVAQRS